jgi:hypothetical protein
VAPHPASIGPLPFPLSSPDPPELVLASLSEPELPLEGNPLSNPPELLEESGLSPPLLPSPPHDESVPPSLGELPTIPPLHARATVHPTATLTSRVFPRIPIRAPLRERDAARSELPAFATSSE